MAKRRARSELGRRLAGPVVILLVAGVITFFVWERQKAETAEVQQFVESLCQRAALGDRIVLSGADPAVGRMLAGELTSLFTGLDLAPGAWRVEVVAGDVSAQADGQATHTATILLDEKPAIGIRLAYRPAPKDPDIASSSSVEVLGYWLE